MLEPILHEVYGGPVKRKMVYCSSWQMLLNKRLIQIALVHLNKLKMTERYISFIISSLDKEQIDLWCDHSKAPGLTADTWTAFTVYAAFALGDVGGESREFNAPSDAVHENVSKRTGTNASSYSLVYISIFFFTVFLDEVMETLCQTGKRGSFRAAEQAVTFG